jgi:hypothetical protein
MAHELKNPMVTIKTLPSSWRQVPGREFPRALPDVGGDIERMISLEADRVRPFSQPHMTNVPLEEKPESCSRCQQRMRQAANQHQMEKKWLWPGNSHR